MFGHKTRLVLAVVAVVLGLLAVGCGAVGPGEPHKGPWWQHPVMECWMCQELRALGSEPSCVAHCEQRKTWVLRSPCKLMCAHLHSFPDLDSVCTAARICPATEEDVLAFERQFEVPNVISHQEA